jgi:vancomycin resistance protein YoaR
MTDLILSSLLSASLLLAQPGILNAPIAGVTGQLVERSYLLASESLDLNRRAPAESVNEGFKENILIAVDHLKKVNGGILVLQPGEVFAFHKNISPRFQGEKIIAQESGFGIKDGYKVIAGLPGNGVCHLASLMNKTSHQAGLEVVSEVNHDFAQIPGIEREYGTSIYFMPGGGGSSAAQNLYIKNNKSFPVEFIFDLNGNQLQFAIKSQL